jgi:hypothetical protein
MLTRTSTMLAASLLASSTVLSLAATSEAALIRRWKLDETSGSYAAPTSGSDLGKLGTSAMFTPGLVDGGVQIKPKSPTDVNSAITFSPAAGALGTSHFTIAFWVKMNNPSESGVVELLGNRKNVGYGNYVSIRMRGDGTVVAELDQDTTGSLHNTVESDRVRINDGQWHHVALVRYDEWISLYVDGVRLATNAKGIVNLTGAHNLVAGRILPADVPGVVSAPMLLDDIRVYTEAMSPSGIEDIFFDSGAAKATGALARHFAPQLRFDPGNQGFPLSAQQYYDDVVATGWPGIAENISPSSVEAGVIPTYYQVKACGSQLRINYWWFYGYQHACAPYGAGWHKGDWEHVMVTLDTAREGVAAVTYYQHEGWYTRLAEHGIPMADTDHPVVYVGATAHGSYYDMWRPDLDVCVMPGFSFTCTDIDDETLTCSYYGDHRSPLGAWMDTWKNLVNLDVNSEPWMSADRTVNFTWGVALDGEPDACSTHPTRQAPTCSMAACDGDGGLFGTDGCRASDCLMGDGVGLYACEDGPGGPIYDKWFTIPTVDQGLCY